MKNCIFLCVFNDEKYLNLLYLFLESLYISTSNLEFSNFDIIIYTSTNFMNHIKNSNLFTEYIYFELNDTYNDIYKASSARLDVFNLHLISNYNKILYLDIDTIIKGNINIIFNVLTSDDVLYTVQDGSIDSDTNYWGKSIFSDEVYNYSDKSAFTTSILLFNNSEKIKQLFNNINIQYKIANTKPNAKIFDQGYIIYNAFKMQIYNNKLLNLYVVNNNFNIYNNFIVYQYSSLVGIYYSKYENMSKFFNNYLGLLINYNLNLTKKYIKTNYYNIYSHTFGNIVLSKANNICRLVLNNNIKTVLKIGFNNSLLFTVLMLVSNANIHIDFVVFDNFTNYEDLNYIKKKFNERLKVYYIDNFNNIKNMTKYDIIHINDVYFSEIKLYNYCKKNSIIIINNYQNINLLWDEYILKYKLENLDIQNIKNTNFQNIKKITHI